MRRSAPFGVTGLGGRRECCQDQVSAARPVRSRLAESHNIRIPDYVCDLQYLRGSFVYRCR
jgi:hypothetical protein